MQLPLPYEVESIISIFIIIFHTKIFNLKPLDFFKIIYSINLPNYSTKYKLYDISRGKFIILLSCILKDEVCPILAIHNSRESK